MTLPAELANALQLLAQSQMAFQGELSAHREQMKTLFEAQKQESAANTKKFMDLQKQVRTLPTGTATVSTEFSIESLANSMEEYTFDPNLPSLTFESWYSRYEGLFKEDAKNLDDAAKVRLLLRKLTCAAFERFRAIILPREPKDMKFDDVVTTLTSIFGRTESQFNRRVRCLQITKREGDDYVAYGGQVNRACEEFQLGKITPDEFKCLIFVHGLTSPVDEQIRTRLLSRLDGEDGKKMKVENLVTEAVRVLNLQHDSAMLEGKVDTLHANVVRKSNYTSKFKRSDNDVPPHPCWKCGGSHYVRVCSFANHKCGQCGQTGHKEGFCASSKPRKPIHHRRGKGKQRGRGTSADKCRSKSVFCVQNQTTWESRRKFVNVLINEKPIRLQYDSGSDLTIISPEIYDALGRPKGTKPLEKTKGATNTVLPIILEVAVTATFMGITHTCRLFVTTIPNLNLFGIEWIELWDLWNRPINDVLQVRSETNFSVLANKLKDEYPTVFDESLGHCTKTKVQLFLKPGSQPIFRPKRPVPSASYQLVDEEIKRLEAEGIISPVDFSNWAAPIVVVKKANGTIRICADYSTGLNDVLEPNQYPLPLPEDIFAKLAGSKIFSIIDLSDAYLQVEVEENSKELLTINTHRGLFRYNRLVPGVKSAPGAFQRIIDSMISGIEGVDSYLDDLIIYGKTEECHERSLRQLLDRIKDFGFHLRLNKCSFGMNQIKYLGHIVDETGLKPDPEKVGAILKMPEPDNVQSLRSFLGAVNFYGKFLPSVHQYRKPLDLLLKKDAEWNWSSECQAAFDGFKSALQSDLLLTHFDPRHETIVAADASNYGIGACLLHRFSNGSIKAVLHAARSLSATEQL